MQRRSSVMKFPWLKGCLCTYSVRIKLSGNVCARRRGELVRAVRARAPLRQVSGECGFFGRKRCTARRGQLEQGIGRTNSGPNLDRAERLWPVTTASTRVGSRRRAAGVVRGPFTRNAGYDIRRNCKSVCNMGTMTAFRHDGKQYWRCTSDGIQG